MENIVHFRYFPLKPRFELSFEYSTKKFNLDRHLTEKVVSCMGRIEKHLEKANSKQKKDCSEKIKFSVQLFDGEKLLLQETFNQVFLNVENLTLLINDESFIVKVNVPSVSQLSLPSTILAGFIVYPNNLVMQLSSIDECAFIWYRGSQVDESETIWEEVGQGFCYIPKTSDINYKLKVKCIPRNEVNSGIPSECISNCVVKVGPGFCPFQKRHELTKIKLMDKKFRVMTYNLLADYYAKTEHSKRVFYPYVVSHAIDIDYRKQLFIKEIIGYNSDIICLQEVDENIFEFDLVPILSTKGLKGNYRKKGTTAEGIATFYDANRFEMIEETGIRIGSNIQTLPIFRQLWKKIEKNTKLVDRITERATTLQVTALRSKDNPEKIIVVANTHLYYHPDANHIRLLQIGFSMLFIKKFINKLEVQFLTNQIDFMFCGDFNSLPQNGIYQLMTEKTVPDTCTDWKSNKQEAVRDVSLNHEFNMKSAYENVSCTTMIIQFMGCVDYIFYQTDRLYLDKTNPVPTVKELQKDVAIPSEVYPSDHIALIADFKWK